MVSKGVKGKATSRQFVRMLHAAKNADMAVCLSAMASLETVGKEVIPPGDGQAMEWKVVVASFVFVSAITEAMWGGDKEIAHAIGLDGLARMQSAIMDAAVEIVDAERRRVEEQN